MKHLPRTANVKKPPRIVLAMIGWTALVLAGCPTVDPEDPSASERPAAGVSLRLAVVDDPALATAIGQLQGEWNAQTGGEFSVELISREDLLDGSGSLKADAVILPSAEVGPLAVQKKIAPIPETLVQDDNRTWTEIFSQLRVCETAWGNKPVAVPFGSPLLTCYYRADLLEKLGRKPPKTWAEYQELSEALADRTKLAGAVAEGKAWHGAIAPLGPGWAGQVLLARAATYVRHRDMVSTLFNIDTMEPLIDRRPFVRALEELVANAALGPQEQLAYDPAAVRTAFWEGTCGLAISWPTGADKDLPAPKDLEVGFAELPGSNDVYNLADEAWEERRAEEDPFVPLLAVAGRMGVVGDKATRPDVAFQLLFWLSTGRWGQQVCAASPATTLFRASHLANPHIWAEKHASAAAGQYAELTEKALSRPQRLISPRIPGRAEYLAALDAAVQKAVRGEATPEDALAEAATRWRQITAQHGLEAQRDAYWQSLGLD